MIFLLQAYKKTVQLFGGLRHFSNIYLQIHENSRPPSMNGI
jgi:hypothetical protein